MRKEGRERVVLFPGSFDPFTRGHADIVARALQLFDRVVVAVGYNEHKAGWIPVEERVRALRLLYEGEHRVEVDSYASLTADYCAKRGIHVVLRGIRSVKDYEYELQIADVNRQLVGIETILLPALPQLGCISSSVVRELAHFGHDIQPFLPEGLRYNINKQQ